MRGFIPVQETSQVQEARRGRKSSRPQLKENKADAQSLLAGQGGTNTNELPDEGPKQPVMPIKSQKTFGRNDRVTVQYSDGKVMKDVKFKSVEEDIKNNKCVLIEQS